MTLTLEQHQVMEGQAPFPLRDEITLPSGKVLRGNRARVYDLLKISAERGERFRVGTKLAPPGCVPNYYLGKPWSGGDEGKKRVRELRSMFGVGIEVSRFDDGEKETATWLYRWTSDPGAGVASRSNRTVEEGSRNPVEGSRRVSGRVSPESAPIRPQGSDRVAYAPDQLHFFTCIGNPGSGAPLPQNLTPHFRHPFAPSVRVMNGRIQGGWSAESAAVAYREELAVLWTQGELQFWIEENLGKAVTFWIAPEAAAAFDPLPVLIHALVRCEAIHLGDWQKAGAA